MNQNFDKHMIGKDKDRVFIDCRHQLRNSRNVVNIDKTSCSVCCFRQETRCHWKV